MPRIFLSPSLQPYNEYYGSGNEQEYMNKLAAAMIPYLRTAFNIPEIRLVPM